MNDLTGKKLSHIDHGQEKYKKIGKVGDHHVYHKTGHFVAVHSKTGKVDVAIDGNHKARSGTFKIGTIESTGKGPKVHKVYSHLLNNKKSGVTSFVGTHHSEGGKKVWQKLSGERHVTVHGWHKGKPVNLDPKDEEETHAGRKENDPDARRVKNTALVATKRK